MHFLAIEFFWFKTYISDMRNMPQISWFFFNCQRHKVQGGTQVTLGYVQAKMLYNSWSRKFMDMFWNFSWRFRKWKVLTLRRKFRYFMTYLKIYVVYAVKDMADSHLLYYFLTEITWLLLKVIKNSVIRNCDAF